MAWTCSKQSAGKAVTTWLAPRASHSQESSAMPFDRVRGSPGMRATATSITHMKLSKTRHIGVGGDTSKPGAFANASEEIRCARMLYNGMSYAEAGSPNFDDAVHVTLSRELAVQQGCEAPCRGVRLGRQEKPAFSTASVPWDEPMFINPQCPDSNQVDGAGCAFRISGAAYHGPCVTDSHQVRGFDTIAGQPLSTQRGCESTPREEDVFVGIPTRSAINALRFAGKQHCVAEHAITPSNSVHKGSSLANRFHMGEVGQYAEQLISTQRGSKNMPREGEACMNIMSNPIITVPCGGGKSHCMYERADTSSKVVRYGRAAVNSLHDGEFGKFGEQGLSLQRGCQRMRRQCKSPVETASRALNPPCMGGNQHHEARAANSLGADEFEIGAVHPPTDHSFKSVPRYTNVCVGAVSLALRGDTECVPGSQHHAAGCAPASDGVAHRVRALADILRTAALGTAAQQPSSTRHGPQCMPRENTFAVLRDELLDIFAQQAMPSQSGSTSPSVLCTIKGLRDELIPLRDLCTQLDL